ncbi:long-chain fatty acid--CoA ligase [Novosphingobium sp.]|uniref:long-chain-fatty-acid--CoA ligase n=1 Tax=Novosphingobium sp. TaxID=1874826 RepID=UPI0022BDE45E|nr:long-chain fatty acid--CoA ligase [Novosphingobium sp.]MCZ8018909.1 long-chain fatty acid--CoA ligase [Novosphingobium sp.]MCZ8034515.1 long-chain fatty acid--CoA ligase [Novosphingobium sp.]MCZ8052063.1 long-chain fatty acid--CoA ligase [Novosphingobium sp.]MCZ8059989.1 long-chain fatty acid--CoA ligase [Novosphingobium sp.]MCZ8230951.1 long-chain fatty acid--CoA ligase [Novosphingobium sp.]
MTVSKASEPWREHYAHPNPWDMVFPPLSVPEMFEQAVRANGSRPLVDFMGRRFTYAQLHAEAQAFATGLQQLGIAKGDRIGLFLPNVPIYVSAYYGAMLAGATVVNFSPLYTVAELTAQVADSGARLLVTVDSSALLPTALAVQEQSALEWLVVGSLAAQLPWAKGVGMRLFARKSLSKVPARALRWDDVLADGAPQPLAIDPEEDLALLQYTGGTTGTPKGAMLTHQNITANTRQVMAIDPQAGERDVIMGVLPMFHVFANICVLNRTVVNGGCIAMLPRFDAGQCLKTLQRVEATAMPGVPTMYQALLDHPDCGKTDFSSLRICISGGAPLPGPLKERFEAASGARLVEGYGLTETAGVASANPYQGEERTGTIGQPIPATRIRLLDKEDPTRDAPDGEPGELAIQGPQVMRGYWRRPEEALHAFAERPDGRWLRTGDVAVLEPGGYLRIVDRIKDMIAVGGFKVFPSEVEAVLLRHPSVKEALVIGVADPYRGETPRAYVTLMAGASESGEALAKWLNGQLGRHERVDAVVVRESLPKTMIGKLDRKALRAEVGVS